MVAMRTSHDHFCSALIQSGGKALFFLYACEGSGFFCYVNRNYIFKLLFLYSEDMWALRSAKKRNVMMQKPENHRAAAGCHSDGFVWLKVMYIKWQEWVTGMAMTQVVAMNSVRNVKWWAPTVAVLQVSRWQERSLNISSKTKLNLRLHYGSLRTVRLLPFVRFHCLGTLSRNVTTSHVMLSVRMRVRKVMVNTVLLIVVSWLFKWFNSL